MSQDTILRAAGRAISCDPTEAAHVLCSALTTADAAEELERTAALRRVVLMREQRLRSGYVLSWSTTTRNKIHRVVRVEENVGVHGPYPYLACGRMTGGLYPSVHIYTYKPGDVPERECRLCWRGWHET